MTKTETQTPIEIDTLLSNLLQHRARFEDQVVSLSKTIRRYATDITTDSESYKARSARANMQNVADALAAVKTQISAVNAEIAPLESEFTRRGGWTRFFIVRNSNGHVHNTMNCSSCNKAGKLTDFGWLPEQSGKTEAEIVELAGEGACTICFPTAPATTRENQLVLPEVAAARAQRAARKYEIAAKKAATGISNPDGTPLRGHWGIIKTERTAQIEAVDAIASVRLYGYGEQPELVERIVRALAHKRGEEFEVTMAFVQAKADQKK